jgi:hypothetical protein
MVGPEVAAQQRQDEDRAKLAHLIVRLGAAPPTEVFPSGIAPPPRLASPAEVMGPRQTWLEWLGIRRFPRGVSAAEVRPAPRAQRVKRRADGMSAAASSIAAARAHEVHEPTPLQPDHITATTGGRGHDDAVVNAQDAEQRDAAQSKVHAAALAASAFDPSQLGEYAAAKRASLLASDEMLHTSLLAIEQARRKYLVAGEEDPCVAEVEAVGKCYHYMTQRHAEGKTADVSMAHSILRCGPYVEKLEKCARALTDRHVDALQ